MPGATRVVNLRDLDIREDSEGNQEWVWGKKTYGPQRLEDAPIPRITELIMVHDNDLNYNGVEGLIRGIYLHQRPLEKGWVGIQVDPVVDLRVIDDDYLLLSGTFDVYGVTTRGNLSARFNDEVTIENTWLHDLKTMQEEGDSCF